MAQQLIIKPVNATLTRDTDFFTKMDPYIVVTIGSQRFTTSVCRGGGKNPSWSDQFYARGETNADIIKFEIWDYDSDSKNDYVCEGAMAVSQITNNRHQGNISLNYKGTKPAGNLFVDIQVIPNQQQGQHQGQQGQYPGQYPPPQGHYPPPQGQYPPPQGQYPPPQGQYPPPQGQYPPPQGQYPPPQGQYPPPQGQYPPPQGHYPPPQGQYPPPQGQYPPQQYPGQYPPQHYPQQGQGQYPGYVPGPGMQPTVKIVYRPTCPYCHGSGFIMKKDKRKQCKECWVALGLCKKCGGSGVHKGKPCKKCRKH